MKPSRFSASRIATFRRLPGTTQFCAPLVRALRMRVSMSAIGSVIMVLQLLPRSLAHAGDLPLQCQLTETAPADPELAVVRTRTTTQLAAVVAPRRELRLLLLLHPQALLRHVSLVVVGSACLVRCPRCHLRKGMPRCASSARPSLSV